MIRIIKKLPELLLITGVAFYWYDTSVLFNPIAIGLTLILGLTIITKSVIIKTFTSITFALLSIFMILAVISEYREFGIGDIEGTKMLAIGLSIFISAFGLSIIMGIKNLKLFSLIKNFESL